MSVEGNMEVDTLGRGKVKLIGVFLGMGGSAIVKSERGVVVGAVDGKSARHTSNERTESTRREINCVFLSISGGGNSFSAK